MSHEPTPLVIERHFDPEDQAADSYPLLPFDLLPGVDRLEVRYTYSDPISPDLLETQPGNVVDLGVLAPDGFRGWSGSARSSFTLTPGWATPGYLPGPLSAGRWHLLLGLYKLAPTGCDVRAEVRWVLAEAGVTPVAAPLSWNNLFDRVARRGAGWYRGDLHSHSHHSEAQGSLHDLLAAARAQGLDFLAITEHNTVSHLVEMAGWPEPPSPLVIPAMELTTYHGHANALGIRRWHDFRRRTPDQMAAL
ncbi:MAG: CehA/McbA family metallohydrolase, partial [Anaerolineae bacterium]|nr:CehA/McbA family metallohydrolase [Anaerolineae bacterium]